MSQKSAALVVDDPYAVVHSTFTIERTYPHSLAHVYSAFVDKATKRRWFAEGEGWKVFDYTLDFRVGGEETSRFSYQGGPEVTYDAVFQDIVKERRIVLAYRMAIGPKPLSASLSTIEFHPSGRDTRLVYTEQGAFFDGGIEAAKGREHGSRGLLEQLAAELNRVV